MLLAARWPDFSFEIVTASTPGDRDKQTPLTTLGQGVFVKGVEEQLLDGRVDLAVHSLKDVPTAETPGLDPRGVPAARRRRVTAWSAGSGATCQPACRRHASGPAVRAARPNCWPCAPISR